jgi:putative nucleotidyltransferase with HDIG domain
LKLAHYYARNAGGYTLIKSAAVTAEGTAFARTLWGIGGLVALVLTLRFFPFQWQASWWLLCPLLVLAAEYFPVKLPQPGYKLAFTLPFLTAIAVTAGPGTAILVDILAGFIRRVSSPQKRFTSTLIHSNLIVSSLAGFTACIVWAFPSITKEATILGLAYALVHTGANLFFATAFERTFRTRRKKKYSLPFSFWAFYFVLPAIAAGFAAHKVYGWLLVVALPILALAIMVESHHRSQKHAQETIIALGLMLQDAHPQTHRHLQRVSDAATEIALRMGMSPETASKVGVAAFLHDIGKIAVDDGILNAPRALTPSEYELVKKHAEFGKEIVSQIPELKDVAAWIGQHHERPDGTGYPNALPEKAIPLPSKIIAVVDAYDAMTGGSNGSDERPYRAAKTPTEALVELENCAGTQFDTRVVQEFRNLVLEGRI